MLISVGAKEAKERLKEAKTKGLSAKTAGSQGMQKRSAGLLWQKEKAKAKEKVAKAIVIIAESLGTSQASAERKRLTTRASAA